MTSDEFVAGDAGYGPLATADEAKFGQAFAKRPWLCRLGRHDWRAFDWESDDMGWQGWRCHRCQTVWGER